MYVSRKEFHAALAAVWEQLEQFEDTMKRQLEKDMTDFATALSDLDAALSSLEGDVTNLQQQIAAGDQTATSTAAAQLEQRVAGIRAFLSGSSSTTTGGTTTPPTTGDTTPPSSSGTATPPADSGSTTTTPPASS